ncbi:MAG: hypothetical protein DI538_07895 [Azospira oryzae]|nr:MAG: hypothetical protein DI538_07895 [Azospira oryzae]
MKCCDKCFNDQELIGFILTNSTEKGNCECCQTPDVFLIDARELEELFQPVVYAFKTLHDLGITVPIEKRLFQKIQDTWKIFRIQDLDLAENLFFEIIVGIFPAGHAMLTEPVEIEALYRSDLSSDTHEKKWESFAAEIKSKNRFFLNETVDLKLLSELLGFFEKVYDPGKIFYRARISDKSGIPLEEMGKPPIDKATSGRANPNGIPYLYVSASVDTSIYESRSSHLDYLTVAEFRVAGSLKIVSLRGVDRVSPFVFSDSLDHYIVHQKYLIRLEQELSKPVRRFDKELDYLPSQYLCEYVKYLGYDAIEYGSSLQNGGINLAIFNDDKLTSRSISIYQITANFTYEKIS